MKDRRQSRTRLKKKGEPRASIPPLDRLILIIVPVFCFGLAISLYILGCIHQQNRELTRQMERWRKSYHLTESQVARIRELELTFHGNGNPFAFRGEPTQQELEQHHIAISQAMPPADGTRFLAALKGAHCSR